MAVVTPLAGEPCSELTGAQPQLCAAGRSLGIKMQSFVLKDAGYTDMIYARALPDPILQ